VEEVRFLDYVKKNIVEYPTLFLAPTFEESILKISDQAFIVLGNGLEWAKSKKGYEGYLTEARYHKVTGDRLYDRIYGKEKYDVDVSRYFIEDYVRVTTVKEWRKDIWEGFISDLPQEYNDEKYHKNVADRNVLCYPYPYFEKKFSCFWEPGNESIQDDWKEAAITHLIYCKDYFNDPIKPFEDIVMIGLNRGYKSYYREMREVSKERWNDFQKNAISFINETLEKLNA
jgi:hypothetical protein